MCSSDLALGAGGACAARTGKGAGRDAAGEKPVKFMIYNFRFMICGRRSFPRIGKAETVFFQALESFTTAFSRPWKIPANFFQGLELLKVEDPPRSRCCGTTPPLEGNPELQLVFVPLPGRGARSAGWVLCPAGGKAFASKTQIGNWQSSIGNSADALR